MRVIAITGASAGIGRAAADMNAFVARAVERFGRLDVMFCNAGFGVMSRETGTSVTRAAGPRQEVSVVANAMREGVSRA